MSVQSINRDGWTRYRIAREVERRNMCREKSSEVATASIDVVLVRTIHSLTFV